MTSLLLALWAAASAQAASWGPYDAGAFEGAQRAGRIIVLQFIDDGCPRCEEQDKVLSKRFWGSNRKDWAGFQVNITRAAAVARQWRVTAPSTLVLLRGTREVGRITGVIVDTELDAFLRKADMPEPRGKAPPRPKLRWPPRP